MEIKTRDLMELPDFYQEFSDLSKKDDDRALEAYLLQCEKESCCRDDWALLVAIYNEEGTFYRSAGNYRRSIDAFQKAQDLLLPRLGKNCMEYAGLLNNRAGTCRLAGQYDKARQLFVEALNIYKEIHKETSAECVNVHRNAALLYQELRLYSDAVYHLKQSLLVKPVSPEDWLEKALTYTNLSVLYHKMEEDDEMSSCMEKAMQCFSRCDHDRSDRYAPGINSLAGILFSMEEYGQAAFLYERAADYSRRIFGESMDYAASLHGLYWSLKKQGSSGKAKNVLIKVYELYGGLLGPDHERSLAVRDELDRIYKEAAYLPGIFGYPGSA